MKRIVSALLSVVLVCSSPVFSIANETERYVTVSVEYSDNIGTTEQLELMVKNDQVYVNAEMLAARLGYLVASNENAVVIYNIDNDNLPNGFTWFFLDSKQVSQTVSSQIIDTYEAPFSSMKNEEGFWIPLEYSLLMLNSGMMILDDGLEIDVPQKDIIDIFYDIQKNGSRFRFDWSKDFGYTDMDWKVIGTSSHLVNLFNGLLELDGGSWAELVQSFAMDSTSYDRRYGENLAMLLCTQSDGELQALREEMEFQQNIFFEEGKLGQFLSGYSKYLDDKVGMLYEESENILEEVRKGNSSVVTYNKTYQALEDAVDKQTWFSETGENILEVQRGMSEAIPILNVLLKVAEVVGYGQEFANQEEFSLSALQSFMETPDTSQASDSIPDAMKDSMIDYASMLSTDLVTYSAARYFQENVGGWIANNLDINKALGTQANAALIAWDIASDVIPFISNGLAAADKFELALYAQVFQADIFMNYQNRCSNVFQSVENINAENLYTLSQYCFLYLKSCYISRNAALGSLEGKRESVKEQIQPLIEEQNGINDEIAEMLIALKDANETNSGNVYGFLPEDNENYLSDFDNSGLLVWVANSEKNDKNELNLENIYLEFLNKKEYQKFTKEWGNVEPEKYAIMDIEGDGYQELVISGNDGWGFYFLSVFGYDSISEEIYAIQFPESETFSAGNVTQYYGNLMYSERYHALVYTELNNGNYFGTWGYMKIEEREFDIDFSLWFEKAEAQEKIYGITEAGNTEQISEAEYHAYQDEWVDLAWKQIKEKRGETDETAAYSKGEIKEYLDEIPISSQDQYSGNLADSFVYKIGMHEWSRGNVDIEGNQYEHGIEGWLARWNYEEELSWAYSVFELEKEYSEIKGRCVLIDSYNTDNFDTTLEFIGDGSLIETYHLTPETIPFDITLNVDGVNELKIYFYDNKAVAGGTSFGLVDMTLN